MRHASIGGVLGLDPAYERNAGTRWRERQGAGATAGECGHASIGGVLGLDPAYERNAGTRGGAGSEAKEVGVGNWGSDRLKAGLQRMTGAARRIAG